MAETPPSNISSYKFNIGGRKMGKTEGQVERDGLEASQGTKLPPTRDPRTTLLVYDEDNQRWVELRTPIPVECV